LKSAARVESYSLTTDGRDFLVMSYSGIAFLKASDAQSDCGIEKWRIRARAQSGAA